MELALFLQRLAIEAAVLVTVVQARGSVPREVGAWMAVWPQGQLGTIGGGHLEWDALRRARERLASGEGGAWEHSVTLGPSLGQCCGGALRLRFEPVGPAQVEALRARLAPALTPLALFGGGHVGRAIVQALAPLPYAVSWVDSRDGVFPEPPLAGVHTEHSDPVQAAVRELPGGAMVLIMSFSHAEDLDIVAACLERQRAQADLPFVGLIGSRTKWATFRRRLSERGFADSELDHITCPIGLPGIVDKAPAVIAAAVVAQLLLVRDTAAPA
ncbi:MAG: xanthine dehydrogenase accessory protein XdhC [Hydrogenophaga sp.]|uniref:xanthine dehydrogenase accessory protein XdhC n=1 Tax=Hydrogenophaga sp. TaxID=1904254 RepID=UPI0025BF439D|nr:xanthine dehydrogenase accessory protein XdhC [Hydrogenophaga sp.]MBT9550828.1 xanthine dehydrogenase accessory protein XdhC [Hydrogenophaga sp.]